MSEEYLAHSKGPWKKHKYIKKVGNKYYYAGSKGYYKGVATTDDANYTDAQKRAAKRINARNAQKKSLKTASRKQRVKNVGVSARLTAQKAGRSATNAINKVTGTTAPQRRAKVRVAKYNVNKAVNSGMAAINKLFGKAKSTAKKIGAQAKNKAYAAPYLAKAYKDKAKFAVSDAKKAAKKVKNTAQRKTAITKGRIKDAQTKRNMNKIRNNVAKAKKKRNS